MDTLHNVAIDEEIDTELEVHTLKVTKSNGKKWDSFYNVTARNNSQLISTNKNHKG